MAKLNKRHRSRVKAIDVNYSYGRIGNAYAHRVSIRRTDGYNRMTSREYFPGAASLARIVRLTLACSVARYQITAYR